MIFLIKTERYISKLQFNQKYGRKIKKSLYFCAKIENRK